MTQNQLLEHINGTIESFLFQSSDSGFSVFRVRLTKKVAPLFNAKPELITARGYLAHIQPGQEVQLQGNWEVHSKFGKQFVVVSCTAILPTSLIGLKRYLGSGLIKGIGESYATKIVDHLGLETLKIIEQDPARLLTVPGIGPERYKQILHSWQEQKELAQIMVFLQDKNISPNYALKIYKRYGQAAIATLTENPYRLAEDIWGIGFKIADQIALKMGLAPDSPKRTAAGILYALSTVNQQGHVYAELTALRQLTVTLLDLAANPLAEPRLKHSLHQLYEQQKIKLITHQEQHYVTLSAYYHSEKNLAQKLLNLTQTASRFNFNFPKIYQQLRTKTQLNLNADQQAAILTCLQNKVAIVTGGPGTGKTTIIKELLQLLEQHNLVYKLAAPTGRAAKRITESTKRPASTLHRLLEFDFSSMQFGRNEHNPLQLDFLIVDEASMLDLFLAYAVVKAVPPTAHLIFIGDTDQLPAVGAGNFLHDLIQSGVIAVTRLREIFRQAQDSLIITNAHRINQGEFPLTGQTSALAEQLAETHANANPTTPALALPTSLADFILLKEPDPANLPQQLQRIYRQILPRYHIAAAQSIVLAPMHKGSAGTQKLNQDLQALLNSANATQQLSAGSQHYRVGDRVIQLRNNYDKAIFNGDIGTIKSIKLAEKSLFVQFDGRLLEYQQSELDELALAYAISIHKSQGSEYAAVIVPLFTQHYTLLQRNLIYTAITRAKRLCIFVGQPKAIAMGINQKTDVQRCTFLQQFLTSDLICR